MNYQKLAEKAVQRYFTEVEDKEGNLLEKIISEIAKEHELNNEEIARVAQKANVKTFLKLFKATDDKTVEFEVANPKNIEGIQISTDEQSSDLSFDESYYKINKEEEEPKEKIHINDLKSIIERLQREKEDLEIKLMENKPQLVKKINHRLDYGNPKTVVFKIKKAGAPEELIKEANISEIPDTSDLDYLIDEDDEFLQKIADYGNIKARIEEINSRLEKAASIVTVMAKHPLKTLEVASLGGEAKEKSKKFKDKLKNENIEGDFDVRKSMKPNKDLYS